MNDRLKEWAEKNRIGVSELAEALDYTYNYTWRLVNGSLPVSDAVLGRILVKFGASAATEIIGQDQD